MGFGDISPDNVLEGGTDGTKIGNVGDRLKTSSVVTGVIAAHDLEFHNFENGRAFSFDHVYTLNSGELHQHALETPDTNRLCYLSLFTTPSDDAQVEVYEAPTYVRGSELFPINRNRNSSNASTSRIFDISSISAPGTQISYYRLGMGGGRGNNPALGDKSAILILKKNTKYLLRLTSNTNGNIVSSSVRFFEYDVVADAGTF